MMYLYMDIHHIENILTVHKIYISYEAHLLLHSTQSMANYRLFNVQYQVVKTLLMNQAKLKFHFLFLLLTIIE